MTCGNPFLPATCRRPSSVRCIVTHFVKCAPLVVMAVTKDSSSSLLSLSFFTNDSMALLANVSDSPPCLWHIRLCTMLAHASKVDGGAGTPMPEVGICMGNGCCTPIPICIGTAPVTSIIILAQLSRNGQCAAATNR